MTKIDFLQYLIEFELIDSTNDYLKNNYKRLPNFTIVKTKFQTNGHGQFGRTWESNNNENLMFSLLIKKDLPFLVHDVNPIIISTLINTLDDFGIEGRFKYPNDIYIGNRKIAGILIETKYDNKQLEYMIIGIGLNINQDFFNTQQAISLKQIINKDTNIDLVFKRLLKHLSNNVFLANLIYLGEENEYQTND
ncbi:MAG: birA [Haloplasmataceae bacterium]|jgi:biotin-[acetyl-CoA-carboxylase] ligase BirA-like protein|nr:birA [Haloplasmataceae bacterium]